jgi:hypothetical protein
LRITHKSRTYGLIEISASATAHIALFSFTYTHTIPT